MVGEGDGLGPLKVGVAGHHRIQIVLGLGHQYLLQSGQLLQQLGDLLLGIQLGVQCHLVVPAAGGVQALARVADALGQDGLDIHVDIFVVGRELHLPGLNVRQNAGQSGNDGLGILLGDDALLAQHGRMGHGAGDILLIQPLVKGDGGVEVVDLRVGLLLEPSAPKFHNCSLLLRRKGG